MKQWFEHEQNISIFGEVILAFFFLSATIILLTYAYIGTFTRYWADDFCFTQTLKASNNLFGATLDLYNNWSNRYTTMLLVGVSEWFGPKAISFLPAAMITLWVTSLTSLINQIKAALKLPRHWLSSLLIASVLAFLTIHQAPDRYQAVYWRSGMVTYFAPLVFYCFSAAFIINRVYKPGRRWSLVPALILVASLFFLSGGLSETTLALQIGGLLLALAATWFFEHTESRQKVLVLLTTGLIASFISLLVVFSAPGNTNRLTSMPENPGLIDLAGYSLRFGWDFIRLSIETLPTPTILTLVLGSLLAIDFFNRINQSDARFSKSRLLGILMIIPLIAYILIVCATAPSVYVYAKFGYPAARALFPSRFILTTALFLMGGLIGLLIQQALPQQSSSQKKVLNLVVSLLIGAAIFYPLNSAQKELASIPTYQKLAVAWDNRDAQIQAFKVGHVENVILHGIESPA